MGILDSLRGKGKNYGGITPDYHTSLDNNLRRPSSRNSVGGKPDYSLGLDNALSRQEKIRQERKAAGSWTPRIKSGLHTVGNGYRKFEKGKKSFGKAMDELSGLVPSQRSSRGRSSGLDFGDMFGSSGGGRRRASGGGRRSSRGGKLVPIYQGRRIVGYHKGKPSGGKRKARRDPWDIDLGI